jgi:hypothetical protein
MTYIRFSGADASRGGPGCGPRCPSPRRFGLGEVRRGVADIAGRAAASVLLTSAAASPCRHSIADAVAIEREAARRTLIKSAGFANSFVRSVGALSVRGRFIPTVLDNKYWFAKLYELITYYEIAGIDALQYPVFVLHFIPIFYDMYYDAFQSYSNRDFGRVTPLWMTHFRAADRPDTDSLSSWLDGVKASIKTGVSAHVQGDMAAALQRAYQSFVARYCLQNLPLDTFRRDFFETNRIIFERAKGALFLELSRMGPFPVSPEVGQFVIGAGESVVGGGLDIAEVYRWRCTAWEEARRALGQAAPSRECRA